MKTQTIGTELEFTGLTRQAAAATVAKHFGTISSMVNGYRYRVQDDAGRTWTIIGDGSVRTENGGEACELVTPILGWNDIETLQEIVRKLRKAGAKVNEYTGKLCCIQSEKESTRKPAVLGGLCVSVILFRRRVRGGLC